MPPPGQNPTAVWDGRSLLAGLEVSLKSWAGLPVTVAVVVVVGGLWCGQIACSAKAHALQPTRATFAFDGLPLLVGGGAGVHGHEKRGPALPRGAYCAQGVSVLLLPWAALVVVCSGAFFFLFRPCVRRRPRLEAPVPLLVSIACAVGAVPSVCSLLPMWLLLCLLDGLHVHFSPKAF